MMKLKYSICCGLDVHKNVIVATIVITNRDGISQYMQKSFSTINSDIQKFHNWLIENHCYHVCMESTGKYWIPIFNYLENDIDVCLTHPKYVKAIKGKKTDKKDSKWIADLYKFDLVRCSFIPPKDFRQLREIARYRFKLVCMKSSEKNRIQNCMTVSNIGIGSVFSDPFGKSAQAIMKEVLESDIIEDEKILKCIHRSCKNKDKILDSIKHCNIETDQRFKMNESMTHMEELQVHIDNCEIEMMKRAAPMFDQFMHITQLPGISTLSAILIISEIGVDMKQFESDKQLTCWAGLAPANNESANKKKSVRISKAGQYLKPLLVQCALGAIKDKEGYFGIKYSRIKKRRGHKKAIIAIARMMLVSIYHMILTGETFNPSDYESFRNPKPPIKQQVLTEESAIEFLKKSGFDVSKLAKP